MSLWLQCSDPCSHQAAHIWSGAEWGLLNAEEPDRLQPVKLVLSGLAAAVLLQASYAPSAEAGVVLEKGTTRKVRRTCPLWASACSSSSLLLVLHFASETRCA